MNESINFLVNFGNRSIFIVVKKNSTHVISELTRKRAHHRERNHKTITKVN